INRFAYSQKFFRLVIIWHALQLENVQTFLIAGGRGAKGGRKAPVVPPPAKGKKPIVPGTLKYRIMQNRPGPGWYWEVVTDHEVIARGLADTRAEARVQASEAGREPQTKVAPLSATP